MRFKLLSAILISLFITGCLTSTSGTEEKRIALYFEVENVGEKIAIGQDSLEIDEFKFAIDKFILYAANDVVLQSSSDVTAFIFGYNNQTSNVRLVIDIGLGFSNVTNFEGYEMFLEPIASRGNIQDDDFFGEDRNYSVIIKGKINNKNFVFRSTKAFDKRFDIDGVKLSGVNETLVIIKRLDINDVFTDEEGNLIDPSESENEDLILSNINANLEIESHSSNLF